jgi:diguanylate cyclase (GGDEF)-like protein
MLAKLLQRRVVARSLAFGSVLGLIMLAFLALYATGAGRSVLVGVALISGIELVLVVLSAAVLLSYQRGIERQAILNRRQALTDPLTGLANRTLFADRTERAVSSASRRGQQVGLLLVDLDGFRRINDDLGRHCGDLLLIELADRMAAAIRDSDTVARIGEDEFGILLPDIHSVVKTTGVAQRIRKAIEVPIQIEQHLLSLQASVGVSVYPAHGTGPAELLRHATAAMAVAKQERLGVVVQVPEEPVALNPAHGPA